MNNDKPINHDEIVKDLHSILSDALPGLPSLDEIKRINELKNRRTQSRNEQIVRGALGKEIVVKEKGSNVRYRGIIVSAELTSNGQAKIMIESAGRTNPHLKVKRGPFFVSKLPK